MRRLLPTRCELIRKLGTLRKTATPATRRNSRFAVSISCLVEIFSGKMRKNSSDDPTSGSHNFSVQTPIRQELQLQRTTLGSSRASLVKPESQLENDPQHGKTLQQPLFAEPHLANPSSPLCKSITLKKKVSQAFQRHQERLKLTSGATSTMREN